MALPFEAGGRNSCPDFRMVQFTDGYEPKGLAYPAGMPATTVTARCRRVFTTGGRYIRLPVLPEKAGWQQAPGRRLAENVNLLNMGRLPRCVPVEFFIGFE